MTIYVFHLPPVFFPGKEALLIIIDEIDRRSISKNLEERIQKLQDRELNLNKKRKNEGFLEEVDFVMEDEHDVIDTKLAYKDMNDRYYYFATILSFVFVTVLSSSIKQIYLVIDFVGVTGINYVSYIQPSIFYLVAAYR